MNPTISVIMAVHNQAAYLPTAIKSILKQTFTNFEFVIINDASTDPQVGHILRHLTDPRLIIISNRRHFGLAKSLNQGMQIARGEFVARMDADDIALPRRFAVQLHYLKRHPRVAACGTAADLIDSQGKSIGRTHYPSRITPALLMRSNPLIHPSVMLRHSTLMHMGHYDVDLNGAEDYDLWLRLGQTYQLVNLPQVLLQYRINPHGISWANLKRVESQAIRARLKALSTYAYPLWQAIYLIKPTASLLVPAPLKKLLFQIS